MSTSPVYFERRLPAAITVFQPAAGRRHCLNAKSKEPRVLIAPETGTFSSQLRPPAAGGYYVDITLFPNYVAIN